MTDQPSRVDRRAFLKGAGAGAAAVTAGVLPAATVAVAVPAVAAPAAAPIPAPQDTPATAYKFLNLDEQAFVEAAVDTLIPADDLSPSGSDCGVAAFIDQQLAGAWGRGDRLYRSGPWKPGKPEQGYQLPLTPAELYRAGIAATNAHCLKTLGKSFDRLTPAQRNDILTQLSQGKLPLAGGLPGAVFFQHLYDNTMEGFFSDPIYGGNRNAVSWKMIGYPGLPAVYGDVIDKYRNKKFDGETKSIADLV